MTWFEALTGFPEWSPDEVRRNITVDGETLTSRVNGNVMRCGRLETPSLSELRERVRSAKAIAGTMTLEEIVADVRALHVSPENGGALFQVASQFNLLEMTSPEVAPEQGVGIYEYDRTQGPACAIAAGAGTIYRNYFVPVNGRTGQSADNQIDCLADLGTALGNRGGSLWAMRNGYALATGYGLAEIAERLVACTEADRDALRRLVRIGIQWNTQVTADGCTHTVSQAYCSALPVAYSTHSPSAWEHFARLVLEAAYEATFCAAILNTENTGNNHVFLTLLGGGAFGNELSWIIDSLERALRLYGKYDLQVAIVSYGASNAPVRQLVSRFAQ